MGWRYPVRRLVQLVPALVAIVVVTFVVVHLAPGDPTVAVAGDTADPQALDSLRRQFGLDRPLWAQVGSYAASLARGDLGDSFFFGRPVREVIGERLPATLLLTGSALVLSCVIGLALGWLAARRPSSAVDVGTMVTTLLAYSVPSFWLGQMAILVFGLKLDLFPVVGMTDSRIEYSGLDRVRDVVTHLVLPATVLAVSEIALVARLTRSGLIRHMGEGYARTASAKGASTGRVLSRHVLPNAALPLVTVVGTRVGFLFSGAVVVETVFSWPGIGLLLRDSVVNGDRPLALGLVLLVALGVLAANLVTDLVYARIDPRIRLD